ncbi:hypothetical protein AK830_g3952 [Neonectria ditissima]|uniref:Protein kinase domain-containing protein n=1 Tax=Neonectria ditissima TaxID=78410 RepID=A0A0P7BMJ9_9HYPO|nr:hypothetical protein AK830_g3952 [Neonectria ditissima]
MPHLQSSTHMSVHYIEEISSGCGDRVSLSIRWNQARLVVHLDPSPTRNLVEDSLIDKYNKACDDEDYEEEEIMSNRILDAIVEAGRFDFDQLAPPPPASTSASPNLHSLLFPEEYVFRFRTVDNEVKLVRIKHPPQRAAQDIMPQNERSLEPFEPLFHLKVTEEADLPTFSTKDILVVQKLMGDGYISSVLAGGQKMCAKVGNDVRADSAQRELTTLSRISASQYADIIRVPKLLGLVQTPHDRRVIGFLEQYIPSSDAQALSSLGDIETASSITKVRRKKWASQVQETIAILHQIGVTWGDGKASNVLIHHDTDDAWIVDFGGGWTNGWLTPELTGTIEGDELAVKKIVEFLEV